MSSIPVGQGSATQAAGSQVSTDILGKLVAAGVDPETLSQIKELGADTIQNVFTDNSLNILNQIGDQAKKISFISLLLRINLPRDGRSAKESAVINEIHGILVGKGEKVIPVLQEKIDFNEMVKNLLSKIEPEEDSSDLTDAIAKRIESSQERWKGNIWDGKNPRFASSQVEKKPQRYIEKGVHGKQPHATQGATSLTYASSQFRDQRELDIDHMDPWSEIENRVKEFIGFVNDLWKEAAQEIGKQLEVHYPGCFIVSGDQLYASQYLTICLYNYPSNLSAMAHFENIRKNNEGAADWLTRTQGIEFFQSVAINGTAIQEPTQVLDQTGFITCISTDSTLIKPPFLGKGLADTYLDISLEKSKKILPGLKEIRIGYQKFIDLSQWIHVARMAGVDDDKLTPMQENFNKGIENASKKLQKARHAVASEINKAILETDPGHTTVEMSPRRSPTVSEEALLEELDKHKGKNTELEREVQKEKQRADEMKKIVKQKTEENETIKREAREQVEQKQRLIEEMGRKMAALEEKIRQTEHKRKLDEI